MSARNQSGGYRSYERERDSEGRFTSDRDGRSSGSYRGGYSSRYDDGDNRSYGRSSREYDDYVSRSGSYDDDRDSRARSSGRQGFASMDRERQREIASMGGRASHGGRSRDYDDDNDYRSESRSGSYGRSSGGYGEYGGYGSNGNRDYEDDYRNGGSSYNRSGESHRGFGSMDEERHRELSSRGGRTSHGGYGRDYDSDSRRGGYSNYGGYGASNGRNHDYDDYESRGSYGGRSSQRGFAGMDAEEQREIASRGGRAAHEYGTAHEWDSREASEAGHRSGMARWHNR